MKKLLIMSIALVAIMATVFTVSAFAANTVTIDGVTLAKYYDTTTVEGVTTQTFNDDYVNVTVNYTVVEDGASGTVDRLTFYLSAQDLASALEGEEAKVIYIDETVKPTENSFSFVIEKDRVRTAFTATGDITTDVVKDAYVQLNAYTDPVVTEPSPFEMTFKLGGANIDAADEYTVVFKNPTMFGDVSGDGKINAVDTRQITRHFGNKEKKQAGTEAFYRLDITGDGNVNAQDSMRLLRYLAKKSTYVEMIGYRKNW